MVKFDVFLIDSNWLWCLDDWFFEFIWDGVEWDVDKVDMDCDWFDCYINKMIIKEMKVFLFIWELLLNRNYMMLFDV